MNMLNSQTRIKDYIELYLKEILTNVDSESGHINIHINQFYKIEDTNDYPRQSFIYFTLACVAYYLKRYELDEILEKYNLKSIIQKLSIKMISNYNQETKDIGKKFIELYSLRVCIFNNNDYLEINNDNGYDFWINNFKKENINLIYTHPVALNLYLNTLKDIQEFSKEIDLANYHLPTAVEAYYNSVKVKKDKCKEAFNYTDVYYFNGINYFNDMYYGAADDFIKEQLLIDDRKMDMLNTSTIAKLFEGFCNKSYYNHINEIDIKNKTKDGINYHEAKDIDSKIQKYFDIVSSRKIKLDTRLVKNFKYTESSISEIKNTSYVCLDTYAHLLLGLMSLYKTKETMIIQKLK